MLYTSYMHALYTKLSKKKWMQFPQTEKFGDKIAAMICICPEQQSQPSVTSVQTYQANYTL